jgi:pimeloyl-ACP methyl ester carboxylesterase
MNRAVLNILLIFACFSSYTQNLTPEAFGFLAYQLKEEELGEVNYYLSTDTTETKKPLLIYLDGSGSFPLFQEVENGFGSTVAIDLQNLRKEYRIVLISKPGVPFADTVDNDENGFPVYKEPTEYTEKLSLDWRVNSANKVIDRLVDNENLDTTKIVVLGFSEGAQVGPKLASKNKNITHLLLFGGNGLNQLFDPVITARMKATRGQISEIESQREIDSLFTVYRNIYTDSENTQKQWWGHTYKRWASFTEKDPYKYLLELEIPIYIANGSLDENSVLSADYIQLEFIKNGKDNLTYKTYPNCNHQFNEIIMENGKFIEAKPKLDAVMKSAFDWLENQ